MKKIIALLTFMALLSASAHGAICLVYCPAKRCETQSQAKCETKEIKKSPCNKGCNKTVSPCSQPKEEFNNKKRCFKSNSAMAKAIVINIEESTKLKNCSKIGNCNNPLQENTRNCVRRCVPFQLEGLTFTSFKPEIPSGLELNIKISSPILPIGLISHTTLDINKNIQPFITYTILRC